MMMQTHTPLPIVEVSAAVLLRLDGSFLLAQRPVGKIWAGYWEFPGGKVEPGETPYHALVRELREELGIETTTAYPWLTRVFTYPHATVRLNFFRVTAWDGELHPHEEQAFAWQQPGKVTVAPVLPANQPILRALTLPDLYAISNAAELGGDEFIHRLELALNKGLRLLQVREKQMSPPELAEFASRVVKLAHQHEARVLINGNIELARAVAADGVHYTGTQLRDCRKRPEIAWCAASCHTQDELKHAGELEFDFALLSPVLSTLSHPDITPLGWTKFAGMVMGTSIPVYALGGLTAANLAIARQQGAHGIALLRQAW